MSQQTTFEYLQEVGQKKPNLIADSDIGSSFLGVLIGNKHMHIPIEYVYKVISRIPITPVSHTKSWLEGISQVDGNVYSVYNLGRWFDSNLDSALVGKNTMIALSQTGGYYGILVEEILGLSRITLGKKTSETLLTQEYQEANSDAVVSVLSVEKLVDSPEFSNCSIFN